jgi:hypothetical protein
MLVTPEIGHHMVARPVCCSIKVAQVSSLPAVSAVHSYVSKLPVLLSWDRLDTNSKGADSTGGAGKTDADSAHSKPASGRKLRFTV